MKTKISHLGRSTVSVILAVMMLLSIMLIGTVSTVNAVDLKGTYYFDNTDANWDNVYMVFIGTDNTYKEYHKMSVSEGKYYKYDQGAKWNANGFYFTNSSNGSSDGTNTTNTFSTKPDSSKNCFVPTSSSGSGSWMSLDDAKASHQSPVADSVTLTANPTSVKAGKPVTLTPTVSGEKSNNLTYTYKKISGGTATEEKNADNSLSVTPSEAGTYKYTVTVSAEGFSSVTSTEVSFTVTAPVQYYLAGRINQDRTDGWVQSINDKYKFTESDTEGLYYYESKNTPKQWSEKVGSKNLEQYFYIIDSSSNKYGSKDNQTDNTPKVLNSTNDKSTLEIISSTDDTKTLTYISNQENVSNVTFWLDTRNGNMQLYYTSATAYSVTFGSYDTSMGSVTAKNGSSNISSGDGVAENSEVTFTATANEGYKFDGWYSDADCTTAITGATDTTYTTTVTADTTVYAKFVAETYNITVKENTNCTVTVNETAAYGSNVNVTVKANDGYTVSSISVTNVNTDDITGNETTGFTFKMPASDVVITPNVKAVDVTAPKVTLNTVTGESTASVKAKENYPITAFAVAGDAYSKITSTDFSVSGGVEGTDYTKAETHEGSGIYNFVALTKGTFTVTYTATATSIIDTTKSTSATATLKITAIYTVTQQAYVALENYVNSVKDTSAGSYTEDSFADFSTALKSAQALLKGLPDADATNTDDYTTALTNLTNARNNLKSNKQYYILGHSAITGGTDTSSATSHDNGIPMKDNGNGDYTYTFSSSDIKSGNDAFCFIDNSDHIYKTGSGASINITDSQYTADNPYTVDILSANQGLYYIGNPTTSKRYTIHLNTATDGKIKVWIEEPPLAYGLQGAVYASQSDSSSIGWSNYSETMSFNADNNYTLKFYAKNSNQTNNQFRLIDSAKINYGSDNPSGLKVALNTDYTTKKASGNVYYVEKSDKPYTIRLTNPGKNPPEFIVTQGAQHSVTVDPDIANGKISVDKNNPYEGDTVTVEATPVSGYVLETVTFNNTPAKVVGNKATFTMPNEDVTVTAAFRTANKYKVTIASDITNGTVTANGSSKTVTVTEGAPVTLVAVPDSSYSFSSWSITPESGYTAEGSMTSATATIYPTADITVSASFAQGTASKDHFLAWGNGEEIKNWTNGISTYSSTDNKVYTAYLNPSYFEENKWYYFAVTNKIPSSGNGLNNNDLYYNTSDITVNDSKSYQAGDNLKTERKENNGNYFGAFQYSGELVSLSISYNEGTKNYQVTPVVKVHNGAKLYAKNGSCRTDKQYANNMHTKGITTISYDKTKYDVDVDTKSSSSWQIAYLSEENIKNEVKLTITTKVKDSEYYLAGWCVDGETYLPKTSNMESNEYSFDYYVKSTTKLTDTIEVTPVYFYKTSADTETVRFYVTGFDDTVKKDWGNTIAVYPYYSGGTSGDVFSNYPGQPMLVSGGRCYVDLPIKYKGGTIAGVTLNNYFYDDVHNGLVSSLGNRQTYDYNDFLKIYEQKISGSTERKSQEIIFSFKYVPSGTSGYNNFGDDSTGKGDKTSVTYPDTISADVMDTLYANGWEDLTDFYGNKVDLYNKKVDASTDAGKKNPWRVISNGYEQTYFGYYATRWAVYKPNVDTGSVTEYSLVDVISSSSLLYNSYEGISDDTTTYSAGDKTLSASSDAEAYKAFKDAGADGVPVKITYEQTIERKNSIEGQPNKNENAFRNDGRWYYSEDNLNVTAHTVIEYANTLDDFSGELGKSFFRDYYQKGEVDYTKDGYDSSKYTGLTTRTSAYFTNDEYYKKTEAKGQTGSGNTFDIIANTDHASEYIFVGWYLLSEGKYSPLTSTVENSVSVPQDNNDVYVARFIKAPSGSLTISHKLHPNTTGLGKCYVSVDVLDKTGKVIHSYDETTSDITVSNAYITYNQGNKIKITLRTVPGEATTFTDFYSYSSDFAKLVTTETGVAPAVIVTKNPTDGTYKAEISFNVDEYLFDKESTDHQQKIKVLNYYSLLSLGSVKYEIKYTFITRLYGPKVYKVSDTLTADDISKYGCTETKLSESFVMAKAPFESNFKQNITWDSNQIKFGSEGGTLTAAITATQVDDRNVTATFRVDSDSPAEDITTNFGNRFFKDGSYISAKDTGTTADVEGLPEAYKDKNGDFSFWYVMTKNKEFVTKAYGQNFAYTGYDNYIVVAVYGVGGTHKDKSTDSSINFLQYSRNHWNDTVTGKNDTGSYSIAGTEYDRLYADFNLMFNHNGYLLNKYSGNDIKVGYAMVVGSKTDGNYTVDETELKTAISENATDGGAVEHQSTSVTAKKAVSVTESDNATTKKNVIVNSIRIADLDNKNRITSYYGFKNSDANRSYYVKVYSYVIADNQVTLSETPVVINLNDIGTKTYAPQQ